MEWKIYDGNNYEYSKELLHYCIDRQIPFYYASSAATYGDKTDFIEDRQFEVPPTCGEGFQIYLTNMATKILPTVQLRL